MPRQWAVRVLAVLVSVPLVLSGCKKIENPQDGGESTAEAQATNKSLAAVDAINVEPITAVSAGLSIASSLKSLFGKDANSRDLKAIRKKLDELSAQNTQILNTLGQIVAILNNLGATIRQNVRLENIYEKQARLMGESRQLYDTWIAEIEDRRAGRQAALRYRNDILPDVRDVTRQLMDEGYGYSAYDTVGHGMLMEFWMSRRLGERASLRRNDANAYLTYFDRALSPTTEGSPGKLLAEAQAQYTRLKPVLDAADARIGANGWEAAVREYRWSKRRGRATTYRDIRVFEKVTGNQQDGYKVTTREQVLREWVDDPGPADRHGPIGGNMAVASDGQKALSPDPAPPAGNTPSANAAYWNAVRYALGQASGEIAIWSKVRDTLQIYRNEAQAVASGG